MESLIGKHIKKLRELKNYTQEYMAARLNITVTAYGNIERDEVDITLRRLQQIAGILEVHYSQIVEFNVEHFLQHPSSSFKTASAPHAQNGDMPQEANKILLQTVNMMQKEHAKIVRLLNKQLNNGQKKLYVALLFLMQSFSPDLLASFVAELA